MPTRGTSASGSARSTSRSPTTPAPVADPAYLQAREAVTAAKNSPWHLRVSGDDPAARALETTLWLWAAVLGRRTARGWEVADLVTEGLSYDDTARRLGITQSAVSQRAQAAGIVESRRARELATRWPTACSGRSPHECRRLGALVLVLLGFGLATALAGWVPAARRIWAPASLAAAARRPRS